MNYKFTQIGAEIRWENIYLEVKKIISLKEANYPQVYYFLKEAVWFNLVDQTKYPAHCPFKGNASYWPVKIGKDVIVDRSLELS
jgi:uncharacterized protein (DUF427 family)